MGHRLEALLLKEIGPLPLVGDIRGRGLFWAVEFVLDKNSKSAFSPRDNFCGKVVKVALGMGLNILGNLGHTGKYQVDHVLVCPPYTTTDAELANIVSLLKSSIMKTSRQFVVRAQPNESPNVKVSVKVAEIGLVEV